MEKSAGFFSIGIAIPIQRATGASTSGWNPELRADAWRKVFPMIDERTLAQPKIIVYSTPTCPHCVMAKRYLSEKGVECEDVNVAADQSRAQWKCSRKQGRWACRYWILAGR